MRRPKSSISSVGLLLGAVIGLVMALQPTQPVTAAPLAGLQAEPAQLTFILSKDATQETLPVHITNSYASPVTIAAELKGIDETAGLLVPTDAVDRPLAKSTHLSQTLLTLAPHQTATLQVQVENLRALSPGGHYATLVLTEQSTQGTQLSLRAALSLSLFAVKVAGAHQQLSLTHISTGGWLFHLPSSVRLSFRNEGNVHAVPRGSVTVFSNHDRNEIAHGIVNIQSLPLLPGKTLDSPVLLTRLGHVWWPQRLHIQTVYHIQDSDHSTSVDNTMLYVPPAYLLLAIPLYGVWRLLKWRSVRLQRLQKQASDFAGDTIKMAVVSAHRIIQISEHSESSPVTVTVNRTAATSALTEPAPTEATTPPSPKTKPKPTSPKRTSAQRSASKTSPAKQKSTAAKKSSSTKPRPQPQKTRN